MSWEYELISLYLFVCNYYENYLSPYCERHTNYASLKFTDAEAIAVFLFGVMRGFKQIKQIHAYIKNHWGEWFPNLPDYAAFDYRMNKIADVFVPMVMLLSEELQKTQLPELSLTALMDSMPIILAQGGRRFNGKVAPEIATANGYCASKKLYYYGVKLHVLGYSISGTLPVPLFIGITEAGVHDRKAYEQILPELANYTQRLFGDKAYQINSQALNLESGIVTTTPVKKEKGQKYLDAADQLLSTAVSRVRQPIESFFNWLQEKTGIEIASKVRSYKGLLVHVFGKIAAAFFMKLNCA